MTAAAVQAEADGALRVGDVAVGYTRGRPVVSDVSLAPVPPGALVALVGPNGAGKSTLLRGLAGLLPLSGNLSLGATDLAAAPLAARARILGYVPQALPRGTAFSVFEGVLSALRASSTGPGDPRRRAVAALERLGVLDLALTRLDRLSGGERQLAALAQALAREPRLLLLDEPTSALDLRHALIVMSLVREVARERGGIVVAVLHDLALACRFCDRIVVLDRGRVAADGAPEAAVTPEILRRVYGVEASLERSRAGHLQVVVERACDPEEAA